MSELREQALTWLRGQRSDDGKTEDIINGLLAAVDLGAQLAAAEAREAALREALELKDSAYAHLKAGQKAKAERLAAASWRRRSKERLESSALGDIT